jgi:hypothetical protein
MIWVTEIGCRLYKSVTASSAPIVELSSLKRYAAWPRYPVDKRVCVVVA